MALNTKLSVNFAMSQVAAAIAQMNSAKIRVYTGVQPATPETATAETLLVEFTMGSPAFNPLLSETAVATSIPGVAAVATGIAGWVRILTSGLVAIMDGSVGVGAPGSFNLVLNSTGIASGQVVTPSSFTYRLPVA